MSNDAMRAYLESRLTTDYHAHPEVTMDLAGCSCVRIHDPAKDVQIGDFLYYYSDQLDSFSLYEVTEINREAGKCEVYKIDSDSPEVEQDHDSPAWPRSRELRNGHCDNFYRPDAEDRARVERTGFESQYIPLFPGMHRKIQPRRLHVRLYYTPPVSRVRSWLARFFGL